LGIEPHRRYSAQEKLAILEAVERGRGLSGECLGWVLKGLGLPRATYYRWLNRSQNGELADQPELPRSPYRPLPEEERLVVQYAKEHPRDGYRRLAWAMVDEDVVYLSASAVYRVLDRHDLLYRWKPSGPSGGRKPPEAQAPDEAWHIDLMYIRILANWYFLVSVLDSYSRYIVHWELCTSLAAWQVTDVMDGALETLGESSIRTPRVIRDNGSQFAAREWRELVARFNLEEIATRLRHPESNGRIERYQRTVREEGLADVDLRDYYHAREVVGRWVKFYNHERLHAALNYLRPVDYYRGQPEKLLAERRLKLERARVERARRWRERTENIGEVAATVPNPLSHYE